MKVTNTKLADAIKFGLIAGFTTIAFAGVASAQDSNDDAKKDDTTTTKSVGKVTVTGSRLKRADVEGATPVQVMTKQDLDQTGKTTVADVMRDIPAASSGNFRPQSGSSAQALATIDLGGLGSQRTLVLIDGRRLPKAPFSASSNDLNSIPTAAIERVEILTDGASAVYGSDAIGGVVNVILRKDFNGAEIRYGIGQTAVKGGDTAEFSATFGTSGERGSLIAGVSSTERGMVYTRDQIGYEQGVSGYGNNYRTPYVPTTGPNAGKLVLSPSAALPGFACNSDGFWLRDAKVLDPNTGLATTVKQCSFDFNAVAANEASTKTKGMFARGEYNINDNWTTYLTASANKVESFGRYAPVPGLFIVPDNSDNDVVKGDGQPTYLYHRLAAFGNRDTSTDATITDGLIGFKGRVWDKVDLDFGLRRSSYRFSETGTGYTVNPLVVAAFSDGSYSAADPFYRLPENAGKELPGVTATIGKQSFYDVNEMFVISNFDVFEMAGGTSNAVLGAEYRKEDFANIFDKLSEANLIDGSSGNSAAGSRNVGSAFFEWLFPIAKSLDITLAGRFDKYSDYGSDFSPKIAMRWQPLANLTFRGSYGEGFMAPDLEILTQNTSFSAESVTDAATCGPGNACQVDTYFQKNANLSSEQSKQYSVGFAFDPTDWFNITADYRDVKISNLISSIGAQTVINRTANPASGTLPAGFEVIRFADGSIQRINTGYANEGDLHAQYLDTILRTRFDLGPGKMRNQLNIAKVLKYEISNSGQTNDYVGVEGLPSMRANLVNTYNVGDWTFGTSHNYIDSNVTNEGNDVASYTLHNIFTTYNTPWNATVQVGVNNVANKYPQLAGHGGRPWNFYLYDAYGRTIYMRYTQRF